MSQLDSPEPRIVKPAVSNCAHARGLYPAIRSSHGACTVATVLQGVGEDRVRHSVEGRYLLCALRLLFLFNIRVIAISEI
jgi:hypothetical protein